MRIVLASLCVLGGLFVAGCENMAATNDHDDLTSTNNNGMQDLTGVAPPDLRSTDLPPAVISDEHPRIYLNDATVARLNAAIAADTDAASRFVTMVDNQLTNDFCNICDIECNQYYNFRAWHAALMYGLTKDTKYATLAIAMVDDCVTKAETRITGGNAPDVAGDSYLDVGEAIGNTMLVYDWCFDQLTPTQKQRWIGYSNQAVWNVWNPDDATWGGKTFAWSGWSINNPMNNYYYSFLTATMLTGLATKGENDQADAWLTMFRSTKLDTQLIPRFTTDLVGGGSQEGTGYGISHQTLFHLYELWEKSTGENLYGLSPHAEASLLWMQHAVMPTRDRLAPIGDHARDSTASLFDYHRNYLQILSWFYDGTVPAQTARLMLSQSTVPEMGQHFMCVYDFLYDQSSKPTAPLSSLYPVYYGSGTGQLYARSAWTTDATWIGYSAGPYTESHAHKDQGQVLLFNKEWLLYDGNIDSHSGIQQGEEGHNVIRIGAQPSVIRQVEGNASVLQALEDEATVLHFAGDHKPAFGTSNVDTNQREVVWIKPNVVVVFDRVKVADTVYQQWNSPLDPTVVSNVATFTGTDSKVAVHLLAPASTSWTESTLHTLIDTGDCPPRNDCDYDATNDGHHIEASASATSGTSFLTVLNVADAASSIARADDSGWIGASFNLTGGGSAIVRFNPAAVGATVEIRNSSDSVILDKSYGATVAALPTLN